MEIKFYNRGELDSEIINKLTICESHCFGDSAWNANQIYSHIQNNSSLIIVEGMNILGYCFFLKNDWELEILRIATLPDHQRQGLGSQMLMSLVSRLPELDFFLEVEDGNLPAIQFYAKWKFHLLDKRIGYYHNGNDALLYKRTRENL